MSRRIDIDTDTLAHALIAADGFIAVAARRLGVARITMQRRAKDAGMIEAAKRLRRATGWRGGPPRS